MGGRAGPAYCKPRSVAVDGAHYNTVCRGRRRTLCSLPESTVQPVTAQLGSFKFLNFKSANGTRQQDTRTLLPTQARARERCGVLSSKQSTNKVDKEGFGGLKRARWVSSCSLRARGGARRALEAAHRSVDLLRAGAREGARDMAEAVAARASNLGHALAVKLVAEA